MRMISFHYLSLIMVFFVCIGIVVANVRQEYVERVIALSLEDGDLLFRSSLRDIQRASMIYERIGLPPEEVFLELAGGSDDVAALEERLEEDFNIIRQSYQDAVSRLSALNENPQLLGEGFEEALASSLLINRSFSNIDDLISFLILSCNDAIFIIENEAPNVSAEGWMRLISIRNNLFNAYTGIPILG